MTSQTVTPWPLGRLGMQPQVEESTVVGGAAAGSTSGPACAFPLCHASAAPVDAGDGWIDAEPRCRSHRGVAVSQTGSWLEAEPYRATSHVRGDASDE